MREDFGHTIFAFFVQFNALAEEMCIPHLTLAVDARAIGEVLSLIVASRVVLNLLPDFACFFIVRVMVNHLYPSVSEVHGLAIGREAGRVCTNVRFNAIDHINMNFTFGFELTGV